MSNKAKDKAFEQIWPKCFVTFMAIVELLAVILLFLTELGNVAANFWKTNVFAGGWGGLILLLHVIFLFVAGKYIERSKKLFHEPLPRLLFPQLSSRLSSRYSDPSRSGRISSDGLLRCGIHSSSRCVSVDTGLSLERSIEFILCRFVSRILSRYFS